MPVMSEENIYECVGMLSKPMQRGKQMFLLLKYTKWSYLGKCQIPVIVKLLSVKGLIPKYTPELSSRIITPEFSGTEHLLQVFLQAIKKENRCLMKLFSPILYCFNFPCDSAAASYPVWETAVTCIVLTMSLWDQEGKASDGFDGGGRMSKWFWLLRIVGSRPDGNWDGPGGTMGDCNQSRIFSLKLWNQRWALI